MKIITPNTLIQKYPLLPQIRQNISSWRKITQDIILKKDKRLLVVVGPCSIHDTQEAIFYAKELKILNEKFPKLFIVMRTYFEKPRTTVGWKGLINDPNLDGSFDIEKGLEKARNLLLEINDMGIPVSTEFLDPIAHNYIGDLITWGAIGARTTESQIHREMASGLKSIIGFKNGTNGSIGIAIDAIKSSSNPHTFLGMNLDGKIEIIETKGNQFCHIIHRGGNSGTNYEEKYVEESSLYLNQAGIKSGIMIDASHANSQKKPENQLKVIENVSKQLKAGNKNIIGVMIESNINFGSQSFTPGKDNVSDLKYGLSITDGCISLEQTEKVLEVLNNSL